MNKENVRRILLGITIVFFLLIILFLFGKIQLIVFSLLIGLSYKLTDYYILTLNNPGKSFADWPNLIVFFDLNKDPKDEIRRKQLASSNYIQTNPWIHLMISKRLDETIDEFCGLCLRDHVYPWLSTITHEDSLAHEAKHAFRHLLATVIRRFQNVDLNAFMSKRLLPIILQTCNRYIDTKEKYSSDHSTEFLRKMYADGLHPAMYNRRAELKYLKDLLVDLMPIIIPKFISDCQTSRHFLRELFVCQIFLDGIDAMCHPDTLNRLFYLYFITAIRSEPPSDSTTQSNINVEILAHFCAMNGELHKNHLALELTDVMYEKELMSQFSRVLDQHSSLGLLSIYLTLSDVLNNIPLASDVLVRRDIHQRLKRLDERYLNPRNSQAYLIISNPYDEKDTLIAEMKHFISHDLEESIVDANAQKIFNDQQIFPLLSRFHLKIYELIQETYQRAFLTSDEHFFYICGRRMDSADYRTLEQNFDEIALDFVHIEESRNFNENIHQQDSSRTYKTTSYQEMEDKDEVHLKCPDDAASISSSSSLEERDLSTWRVRIDHVEELRENINSNSKYCAFIIEIQRLDFSNDNPAIHDEEKPHWIVARRYQDFYLLEQKLTEFHGIFDDARLPPRRSTGIIRNVEFLESIKNDFEHFLRHLLSKPTLRNSELLYNFLVQPDEFTLPNGEIILAKMFKVVPRALRIEKGQSLEPFLISLLNYIEPSKPKATQPSPVFSDIIEEKLQNSIYGNNADISESKIEQTMNNPFEERDSTYEYLVFLAKRIFSASPLLIHLLNFFRVPLKNTVDTFFSDLLENKMDDVLNDEENIINVIHVLRDTIFPNDVKDYGPTDLVNFDDVVASAEEFIPNVIKLLLGRMNVQNGLRILFQHFQDPLLNKQLFYTILDEMIFQLFPELQDHSNICPESIQ